MTFHVVFSTEKKQYLIKITQIQKRASEREKRIKLFINYYCVILQSRGVSLADAAEEAVEIFENEKEVLTEDKLTFNQYNLTHQNWRKNTFA